MLAILAVTLPVFLLIGLGYLAVRFGLFTADQARGLGRFVITFALPALVFRALSQRSLGEIFDGRFLAVYGLASLASLAAGVAWFRLARGRGLTPAAVRGLGMAASNSGFIGYPVAAQFLGPVAGVALALIMLIENLIVLPTALALAEGGRSEHAAPRLIARDIALSLVRMPLLQAIILGMLFAVAGLQPPAPVAKAVSLLADASAPVALFAIGGTLVGLRPSGLIGEVAPVAIGKLVLHPLLVVAAMLLIPIGDPALRRAAIVFACAPMFSVYPIIGARFGDEKASAAALLAATTASFTTVTIVLWLLDRFMPAG